MQSLAMKRRNEGIEKTTMAKTGKKPFSLVMIAKGGKHVGVGIHGGACSNY